MQSQYRSPFTVGKRKTVYIDAADPRVQGFKANITAARLGAELVVVDSRVNTLSQAGRLSNIRFSSTSPKGNTIDPKGENFLTPLGLSNVSVAWEELSGGPALVISFDFDFNDPENKYVSSFGYTLTGNSETTPLIESITLNKDSAAQRVEFTYALNTQYYGLFQTSFTELKIAAYDSFGNNGPVTTITSIPSYSNSLPAPVITVTSIPMGYSVDWNPIAQTYQYISIEEVVSDAGTAPTTGYQQVYLDTHKPANVITPTTESRWVKARFTDKAGTYGPYSNAVKVTPTNPVSADLIPPSEVTSVSAAWSGDNIVISYTLPATDAGSRFQVGLTAPNSAVGYFYAFPSGTSLNQTYTITKADLFAQFGSHYSSYTGVFKSIDAADNKSNGVAFTVAQRANPLLGITPTFTTTALVNGYNVSYTLPAGAVYAEVYQKYTTWSGVTPYDSFSGTYSSGGASGTNTVTLSNVLSNKGISVTPLVGFIVIGTGIPENTYITAVSGNQITVNNNFTSQVSGSITGYGIVYSGTSPANISSTLYQNTYLLVRYYDDFENPSNYSAEQVVVPLSPVTVDISGPGDVSTVNTPSSGIDTSGTLGFNGYINLTWTAVSDTTLRGYRIRFTTDTTNPVYSYVDYPIDQTNPPTGTLSYKLAGLAVGATYKLAIATYDEYNNTSSSYVSFTDTTISGTPAITDYITAGNFQFGQGVDPTNTTGITGTKRGLFFDDSNYWFLNASDSARLKVGGSTSNYLLWNGTKFTVDGDITARGGSFSGNIALTTSGASIYSGDVTTSPGNLTGDGFIFNKDGLLIRKGTNQVSLDTTNGAITANAGNIADWVIHTSKIEKLDPTTTKYAGLSSTGFYKFWSGSTSAGGDATQFAVDRTGKLYASSAQISGGTLDVGPAWPSGFHVDSSGNLKAAGAIINGEIQATSGEISGNFQIKSTGSFYAGNGTTSSVVINTNGMAALDSSGAGITEILTSPITYGSTPKGNDTGATSGNPLPVAINFFTKGGLIAGWVVGPTTITDRSQQFVLDSTNKRISITGVIDVSTNYMVRFGTDLTGSGSGTTNIFEAGVDGQTPNVYITRSGILNAIGANLTGTLTVSGGSMKFGDNVNGTNDGIYIDSNDYWYDNGAAKFGNGTIEILTDSTVKFATGNIEFNNVGDFLSDDNNYAGDPTITLNTSNKLTQGRRLIYNTTVTPQDPFSWNNTTKTGDFLWKGTTSKPVKTGDLIFTT